MYYIFVLWLGLNCVYTATVEVESSRQACFPLVVKLWYSFSSDSLPYSRPYISMNAVCEDVYHMGAESHIHTKRRISSFPHNQNERDLWIRWSLIICFNLIEYFLKTPQFIGSSLNLLFWCLGLRSARSLCAWRAFPKRCLREICEDVVLVQIIGCWMTSHLSTEDSEWGKSFVFLASGIMDVVMCLQGLDIWPQAH